MKAPTNRIFWNADEHAEEFAAIMGKDVPEQFAFDGLPIFLFWCKIIRTCCIEPFVDSNLSNQLVIKCSGEFQWPFLSMA